VVVLWLLPWSPLALTAFLLVVLVVGTWASDVAERTLGTKDPGAIVVDEVAGMTISVLTLPLTPVVLVVGFILFRIFDVVKPFPAGVSQRLGGGVGVMIDDVIAGLYALVLLLVTRRLGWL
jgi:phosphatidylglycerophosphatase A